jgi:hypothetical protein
MESSYEKKGVYREQIATSSKETKQPNAMRMRRPFDEQQK